MEEEDRLESTEREFEFDFTKKFSEEEEVNEEEVVIDDAFNQMSSVEEGRSWPLQRAMREAEFEGKKYEMPTEEFKERLDVPRVRA